MLTIGFKNVDHLSALGLWADFYATFENDLDLVILPKLIHAGIAQEDYTWFRKYPAKKFAIKNKEWSAKGLPMTHFLEIT